MLRIFRIYATARGGAQEDRFRPSCESPEQGRTLDPCGVRFVASVGFDESNPRSKRRGMTAQSPTRRLPHSSELMALAHHAVGLLTI